MRRDLQKIVETMRELKEIPNTKNLDEEVLQNLAIDLVKIQAIREVGTMLKDAIEESK